MRLRQRTAIGLTIAAARLAGLADPDAHAEQVQAAFREVSGPRGVRGGLMP